MFSVFYAQPKLKNLGCDKHTGIAEDEVRHSGAKQLFSGFLVWSIFHNDIELKSSRAGVFRLGHGRQPAQVGARDVQDTRHQG